MLQIVYQLGLGFPLYSWETNAPDEGTEAGIGVKEVECRFLLPRGEEDE